MSERDRFPEEGEIEKIPMDGQGRDWNLEINGEEGGKKASGQGTQRGATKIGYIYIYTYIYTNTMFNVIFWYK